MTRSRSFFAVLASALLLTAGATAVSVPSAGAQTVNCSVAPADQAIDGEEQSLLNLINQFRVANGKNVLRIDADISRGTAWHSRNMATNNYLSHVDSLGRSVNTRMWQCGAGFTSQILENAAAGSATGQGTFDQWKGDPAHNATMLAGGVAVAGIARSYNAAATYRWYWSLDIAPARVDTFDTLYFPAHWGPNQYLTVPASSPFYRSIALIDNTGDPTLSQHIQTFAQIVNGLHNGYNANYPVFLYYKDILFAPGQPCAPGPPQYVVVCRDETLGGAGANLPGTVTVLPNPRPANHILNATVRFRPSVVTPWCSGDKFTLVVRLVGTALGLDKNLTDPASAMFPTTQVGRCMLTGWTQAELDRMSQMYSHQVA